MKTLLLMTLTAMLVTACGKASESTASPETSTTSSPPATTTITSVGTNTQGNSPTCPTPISTPNDSQALADIGKLSQSQCQNDLQQLLSFYSATQGMTDAQRQAYFQQMTAGVNPPPPPPPPYCSVPFVAIEKCAQGQ